MATKASGTLGLQARAGPARGGSDFLKLSPSSMTPWRKVSLSVRLRGAYTKNTMYSYLRITYIQTYNSIHARYMPSKPCAGDPPARQATPVYGYMRKKPAPHVQAQPQWEAAQYSCAALPRPMAVRINSAGIRTPLEPLVINAITILAP